MANVFEVWAPSSAGLVGTTPWHACKDDWQVLLLSRYLARVGSQLPHPSPASTHLKHPWLAHAPGIVSAEGQRTGTGKAVPSAKRAAGRADREGEGGLSALSLTASVAPFHPAAQLLSRGSRPGKEFKLLAWGRDALLFRELATAALACCSG